MMTAAQSRRAVSYPGKFEGEAAYVPYFWDLFLEGFAGADHGDVMKFRVQPEDRALFPELKGRHWVSLRETDQGFVVEDSWGSVRR
jgi:hypothetical protein